MLQKDVDVLAYVFLFVQFGLLCHFKVVRLEVLVRVHRVRVGFVLFVLLKVQALKFHISASQLLDRHIGTNLEYLRLLALLNNLFELVRLLFQSLEERLDDLEVRVAVVLHMFEVTVVHHELDQLNRSHQLVQ